MKTTGRKNPALVELVLVILFFALSSMVLVQVFVKAKVISQTSQAKTLGLLLAQDVLEQWKADPARPEKIFLPDLGWREEETEGGVRRFVADCDKELYLLTENALLDSVSPRYCLIAELSEERKAAGRIYRIQIKLIEYSTEDVVLDCGTAKYLPGIMRKEP